MLGSQIVCEQIWSACGEENGQWAAFEVMSGLLAVSILGGQPALPRAEEKSAGYVSTKHGPPPPGTDHLIRLIGL